MRILVTGGAGFVGTNLIKGLLEHGHEIVSIDNYSIGKKENHLGSVNYLDHNVINMDDFDGDYDLCYHLAGL